MNENPRDKRPTDPDQIPYCPDFDEDAEYDRIKEERLEDAANLESEKLNDELRGIARCYSPGFMTRDQAE